MKASKELLWAASLEENSSISAGGPPFRRRLTRWERFKSDAEAAIVGMVVVAIIVGTIVLAARFVLGLFDSTSTSS